MGKLVSDELWNRIEPLLPKRRRSKKGGRPAVSDRAALSGILYVLRSGLPWRELPTELGCSGVTAWRRLQEWDRRGIWNRLHRALLNELGGAEQLDLSRVSLDTRHLPAKRGGAQVGPDPVNRGKPGCKHHLIVDRAGIPLAADLSAANLNDHLMLPAMLDAMPPIHTGRRGRRHGVPGSSTPTKLTTTPTRAPPASAAASCHALRAKESSAPIGWDGIAGWSNVPSAGSCTTGV